jgi:hypothetical protein
MPTEYFFTFRLISNALNEKELNYVPCAFALWQSVERNMWGVNFANGYLTPNLHDESAVMLPVIKTKWRGCYGYASIFIWIKQHS